MFGMDKIAIDITQNGILILVGRKTKIKYASTLETPIGSYEGDRIINVGLLAKTISQYLVKNNIRSSKVMFSIKGQDVLTRHITTPALNEKAMREAVLWELKEYLNERVDEYYYDYEVLSETRQNTGKTYNVVVSAVEKEKIDSYLKLAEILELDVVSLDIYATIGARIVKNLKTFKSKHNLVGLLAVNSSDSSFYILNGGNLAIEKYQNIGILGQEHISVEQYNKYINSIDLTKKINQSESTVEADKRIRFISSNFNSLIQFYMKRQLEKQLDKIYLTGSCVDIKGMRGRFSELLNTKVEVINKLSGLKHSIRVSKNANLLYHFYSYGLFLKDNKKQLNMLPYEIKMKIRSGRRRIAYLTFGMLIGLILVGGVAYLEAKKMVLNSNLDTVIEKINSKSDMINQLNKVQELIDGYKEHIDKVDFLQGQEKDKMYDLVLELESIMPNEIKVDSFNIDNNKITMSASSDYYYKITEFWANLRESEKFKNSNVKAVDLQDSDNKYHLNLDMIVDRGTN